MSRVPQEANAKLELEVQAVIWGKYLWKLKREEADLGKEALQTAMRIWHPRKESREGSRTGQKSLRLQSIFEKGAGNQQGALGQRLPTRGDPVGQK